MDGTFANYSVAKKNIERCIKHKRKVGLLYLYQDPLTAWKFVKIREVKEGRNIPIDAFVKEFFNSRKCVNRIKSEFGSKIELSLIKKDLSLIRNNFDQGIEKTEFNIDNVDSYIKMEYTSDSLYRLLEQAKI